MKWTTAHFRATAYAAGFLFLVVCAWSLLEVSRVRQLRLAIATRQRDVDVCVDCSGSRANWTQGLSPGR
jgi:hypothetical protein